MTAVIGPRTARDDSSELSPNAIRKGTSNQLFINLFVDFSHPEMLLVHVSAVVKENVFLFNISKLQ